MNARLLGGVALLGALALPSAAVADTTLTAGPLKVKGYDMTVVANDAGSKDTLSVMFNKTAGKELQTHMYSFDSGVNVTATKVTANLGRYGKIDLALTGARPGRSALPKGCTGKPGRTLTGTLRGSLRFTADKTFFKTVTAKTLRGQSFKTGKVKCAGDGGDGGGTPGTKAGVSLSATGTVGGRMISLSATNGFQSVFVMEDDAQAAPAAAAHFITAGSKTATLKVAGDLSSATIKGERPFITGTGTFSGEGFGTSATGTLSGDLAAKFDSIGTVKLTGDDLIASLFKR